MKKSVLCFLLIGVMLMTACSSESSKVENSIKSYVTEKAMDPDKVKYEIVYSSLDTVPYYLKSKILSRGADYAKIKDDFLYTKQTKDNSLKELQEAYLEALANQTVAYISCVNVTEETPFGSVNEGKIIICDKENPDSIIGAYRKSLEFVNNYKFTKEVLENYKFKTNEFGQVITDSLSEIEKFIMKDIKIE